MACHDIVGRSAAMIAIGGTADADDHGGGAENGADDPEQTFAHWVFCACFGLVQSSPDLPPRGSRSHGSTPGREFWYDRSNGRTVHDTVRTRGNTAFQLGGSHVRCCYRDHPKEPVGARYLNTRVAL